jgi:O-methyltransferase
VNWGLSEVRLISRLYRNLLRVVNVPLLLSELFDPATGADYGVGRIAKVRLVLRFFRNHRRISTASSPFEHIAMAVAILRVPAHLRGDIVECGTYKGGSAANLSLVAALCGRRLHIFDSFAGLPEPEGDDVAHVAPHVGEIHPYARGNWRGALEEVRENLRRCGRLQSCVLHPGYFDQTLPGIRDLCSVLIFLDVDLRASLEVCVRHLWPTLQETCSLFTHEAPHLEIASLFYDREWWNSTFGVDAPGLVGAGNGLGLHPGRGGYGSPLGYVVKRIDTQRFVEVRSR